MTSRIQNKPHMNPYDYHKYLINEYVLLKPGDTKYLQKKSIDNFKSDKDVIMENMRFIWNEESMPSTYEERLAKKYYDKLFREYAICDLSRYKENKIGNRFRVEKEVIVGKGQFICGEKLCSENTNLRSWEVNFAYTEKGDRKNALVKIRLCDSCSEKLNYHSKKREIKRLKKQHKSKSSGTKEPSIRGSTIDPQSPSTSQRISQEREESPNRQEQIDPIDDDDLWKRKSGPEIRGRDEEFDEYLADLLL
ncbi:protein FRA10AC1 homolog [Chironomus tepperi]|uniref:protein FRA10AC1 homolog n=1 Tax=Chironomus tepperi TaxID=113505 RepID=UPI00391F6C5B